MRRPSMQKTLALALTLGAAALPSRADDVGVLRRAPVSREAEPAAGFTLSLATLPVSDADYAAYQKKADSLYGDADAEAVRTFFDHLRRGHRPPLMRRKQWHACVNDVFARLIAKAPGEVEVDTLLATAARKAADTVVRDYALQHLALLAGAGQGPGEQAPPPPKTPEAATAIEVLWEATGWRETSLAGTALLNLYRLKEGMGGDTRLADTALEVASDPGAHGAARSTALQVGLNLGDARFLEPARTIADRTPVLAHRVSATRVLATHAKPEDRTLLLQLRLRGPELVSTIANEALTRLDHEKAR